TGGRPFELAVEAAATEEGQVRGVDLDATGREQSPDVVESLKVGHGAGAVRRLRLAEHEHSRARPRLPAAPLDPHDVELVLTAPRAIIDDGGPDVAQRLPEPGPGVLPRPGGAQALEVRPQYPCGERVG